jgi:hypothetical protein
MMVKGGIKATSAGSGKTVILDRKQSSTLAGKYGDSVAKAIQKAAEKGKAVNKTALVALLTTKGSKLNVDKARQVADKIIGNAKPAGGQVGNPLKDKSSKISRGAIERYKAFRKGIGEPLSAKGRTFLEKASLRSDVSWGVKTLESAMNKNLDAMRDAVKKNINSPDKTVLRDLAVRVIGAESRLNNFISWASGEKEMPKVLDLKKVEASSDNKDINAALADARETAKSDKAFEAYLDAKHDPTPIPTPEQLKAKAIEGLQSQKTAVDAAYKELSKAMTTYGNPPEYGTRAYDRYQEKVRKAEEKFVALDNAFFKDTVRMGLDTNLKPLPPLTSKDLYRDSDKQNDSYKQRMAKTFREVAHWKGERPSDRAIDYARVQLLPGMGFIEHINRLEALGKAKAKELEALKKERAEGLKAKSEGLPTQYSIDMASAELESLRNEWRGLNKARMRLEAISEFKTTYEIEKDAGKSTKGALGNKGSKMTAEPDGTEVEYFVRQSGNMTQRASVNSQSSIGELKKALANAKKDVKANNRDWSDDYDVTDKRIYDESRQAVKDIEKLLQVKRESKTA